MGDMVEFKSNGDPARGYLATPQSGSGPGVIVVQEWWGLNPQIKGVADRLAKEGFVALAPDLYRGELAQHDEMDKAGQLMSSLPMDRAARDMGGAVDYLAGHGATTGSGIGAIGFCMGGGLVLALACLRPDWSKLEASVDGHYGEKDDFFPAEKAKTLEEGLRGLGKEVTVHVYPGTGHAFANEDNPLGTHDEKAANEAFTRAITFLHSQLA